MLLSTDNIAGASPEIVAALARISEGDMAPYGADPVTERLTRRFSDLFNRDVEVYPTVSGTAANALSLALIAPAHTAVYCHENAHILDGEMGAFEFYSQGARLVGLGGGNGRIEAAALGDRLRLDGERPNRPPARAVSLTQLTEAGTLYRLEELRAIGEICRARGLALHVDGARFAVAVAALGVSPAEASADLGVDILSFGGTKNGTLMADCIVVFTRGLTGELQARRKRAGLTVAKMRFLSAQLEAYLENGLWLRNATCAINSMKRLVGAIGSLPGVGFQYPPEGNELFLMLDPRMSAELAANGVRFRPRSMTPEGWSIQRLVTSFATTDAEIDMLARSIEKAARIVYA